MSRSRQFTALAALCVVASTALAGAAGLGRTAKPEEIAAWDIDVRPDGQGLPVGRGSVADGEAIFEERCAVCHGSFGESQEYMALAGGVGSLATTSPQRTVGSKLDHATTLWDYINRAMPFNQSKSLTVDEVYAVSAYVLSLNDILPADATLDRESLIALRMPNRDGYTTEHGFGTIKGEPDTRNTACMKNCEAAVVVTSQLPDGFTQQFYGDITDHFRSYAAADVHRRAAAACTPGAAGCASAVADAGKLVERHSCTVCHAVDSQLVGPAFREVARRYAGDAAAADRLLAKLNSGGSGAWGEIPMPSQAAIPADELKAIVHWILEMKQ